MRILVTGITRFAGSHLAEYLLERDELRDGVDVRDVVGGYWLALEKGVPGEVYNIGNVTIRTVQYMLDMLLALSPAKISLHQDASRLRPCVVPILWSDDTKSRTQTGWEPEIPFEKTMADLLEHWRGKVKGDGL